ncbi:hypothetical protein MKK58_07680 [Methylobacterium sp. J-078]|uniref:nitrate- and nitrite sensing domain-containing protein n=1 Tax=Methylobacterium sp. J-078 TaxID=2836657 RepID=UPI001FBB5852|nr:nitrate- and nitrite sensing domain-containing protein [Methylobacterium sp. J-078]MCJ2044413.1 hypothetical protein [Methylobacterium sp. J-078]
MSKETGLAVDQLRAFGALGERFGVSAETMQGGVRKFADEMSRLRKRYGEAYSDLQAMNLGEMVEKMVSSPNMKAALDSFMESVSNIGDPVKRRKVVEMVLGSDQIAAVAGQVSGRYRAVMDEILKAQGTTTDAQVKAAQRFETALSRVRENMDGLRTQALGPLLEQLSSLVEKFGSADTMAAFGKQLEEIGKFARTTVQEFEAIVRTYEQFKEFIGLGDPSKNKEFTPVLGGPPGAKQLEGRRDSIEQQRKLLDANPSTPDYQRKRDRMTDELKRVGDELEKLRSAGGATAQPSSYGGAVGGGGGGLIHKAAYGRGGSGGYGGVGSIPPLGLPDPAGGGSGNANVTGGSAGRGYQGEAGAGPMVSPPLSSGTAPLGTNRSMPGISARDMRNVHPEIAAYIRNSAARHGIDPSVALRIANSEGLRGSTPNRMTPGDRDGAGNYTSFGPFQLHYAGRGGGMSSKGLGDAYTRETGHHASDPTHWREQIDFAMRHARKGGWGPWHGRIGAGIGVRDGIGTYSGPIPSAEPSAAAEGGSDVPYYQRPRSNVPGGMSRLRDDEIEVPGSGARSGDKLMGRMFSRETAAPPPQSHRMTIDLNGFPAGTRARTSMGDLFKETTVSKSRQVEAI